jgi:hypothetical protein
MAKRKVTRCHDCKKPTPKHIIHSSFYGERYHCCNSFLYYAPSDVWLEATRGRCIQQLCLGCLRKRLGRDLQTTDITRLLGRFELNKLQERSYTKFEKVKKLTIKKIIRRVNSGNYKSRLY